MKIFANPWVIRAFRVILSSLVLGALYFRYFRTPKIQEVFCLKVLDGDTLMVREKNGEDSFFLRLSYIDAPELAQKSLDGYPVGEWSKKFLQDRALGRVLTFQKERGKGRDLYGRRVGQVWVESPSLNFQIIEAGMAFLYPFSRFNSSRDKLRFMEAHRISFLRRKGIWRVEGLLNPYQYRKLNKFKKGMKNGGKVSDRQYPQFSNGNK